MTKLEEKVTVEMVKKSGGCKTCKTGLLWNESILAFVCKCRRLGVTKQEMWETKGSDALAKLVFDKIEASAEPEEWAGFEMRKRDLLCVLSVVPCLQCGGRFDLSGNDPVRLECVCGLSFRGDELSALEFSSAVAWLVRRTYLLAHGHEKCGRCNGLGGRCTDCRGSGAREIYDCNGNCHECKGSGKGYGTTPCLFCRGVATLAKWYENAQA